VEEINVVVTKRLGGLVFIATLTTVGFFFGPEAGFPIYAGSLGTMYSVYATSQGFTDGRRASSHADK